MNEEIYRKYARLTLQVGVNLQAGQKVYVTMDASHREFGELFVEEAYKLGAGYVLLEMGSLSELASRIQFSEEENLDYLPSWVADRNRLMVEEQWAKVGFGGSADPDLLGSLDQAKLGKVQQVAKKAAKPLAKAAGSGKTAWTVGVLPTPKWAASIFPDDTEEEALEKLWSQVISILRLEKDDPSVYWRNLSEKIIRRNEVLEKLDIRELHYKSADTDLKVKCLPGSIWKGGAISCRGEYMFLPNLPTFENFTTPDFRQTSGYAKATRPTEMMGSQIVGAWFKFEQGKVVDYGADENDEVLKRMFSMCPQAKYLGEAALVDNSSPIYQSGIVFNSILLDENASCHIALGSGYAAAAPNTEGKNDEQLLELGCNVSLIHQDFMIGSDDLNVTALLANGETVSLIEQGLYADILSSLD